MFKNIVLGMSGGVDSSVAALLLKRKGFNVTAVFLRNWDTADETGKCLADEDYRDADYVCKKLDIPLIEVNFVKEYWNDVFSYFLESYQTGYTPNPDIMCNKNIKFNKFYNYAINNLNADAVATGHYARTSFGPYLENYKQNTKVKLLKAADNRKDQTFFMSQVNQDPLQRCMFPLGDYKKPDVKRIAREAGLEMIANKDESMGICFIGSRTFQNFISEYIENKPGNFVDYDTGKVIAQHQGIHYWTLGQRARIHGGSRPYYVFQKDVETNTILVVQGQFHPASFTRLLITSKPHWIYEKPKQLDNNWNVFNCEFKFQHKDKTSPCQVFNSINDRLIIAFEQPHRAISPGQFAVLYSGEECLGSAAILHPGPSLHSLGETLQDDVHNSEKIPDVAVQCTNK
ncbi:hypothetical protein PV326_005610 [Microctonus aethiopoides]|uniref:tRNA-5-taurinomethyluridine 2-sulfurtransferase n=2 Tax=Microctonus aethiopoides TaxID=144406 RepID=A0AA39KW97_9HYME|nr:hypothetical protein PV326_005610 [Microctonus aethiopoides]KAK0176273.1 hypothetical protein PV328_000424 [Microctonus aethiopoides]